MAGDMTQMEEEELLNAGVIPRATVLKVGIMAATTQREGAGGGGSAAMGGDLHQQSGTAGYSGSTGDGNVEAVSGENSGDAGSAGGDSGGVGKSDGYRMAGGLGRKAPSRKINIG